MLNKLNKGRGDNMNKVGSLDVEIGRLSCGVYAINLVLKGLGYEIIPEELEDLAHKYIGEANFGSLYTQEGIEKLLELTNELIKQRFSLDKNPLYIEKVTFEDINSFEELLLNNTEDGYILMPYYALQGLVWKDKKPNMKHGHWCIVYDYKDSKIYGNQSNQKGEKLGALNGVHVEDFYESHKCLDSIKIDWGKYNKCKICIAKKQLGTLPRCGIQQDNKNIFGVDCSLVKNKENLITPIQCIYKSELCGLAYVIKKNNSDTRK